MDESQPGNLNPSPITNEDLFELQKLIKDQKSGEFAEFEIEPIIEKIFNNASEIPATQLPQIRLTLMAFIDVHKSTAASRLYRLLEKNKFPFSEELLRYAIDHEDYYNNNPSTFRSYLIVASLNSKITAEMEPLTSALGRDFYNKELLEEINTLGKNVGSSFIVPESIKETILHILRENEFSWTRDLAICASVYLHIENAIPVLNQKLEKEVMEINNLSWQNMEDAEKSSREINSICASVEAIAMGLYFLTNDVKYQALANSTEASNVLEKTYGKNVDFEYIKQVGHKLQQAFKNSNV